MFAFDPCRVLRASSAVLFSRGVVPRSALILVWLVLAGAVATAETRVALVIGNGAYQGVATLANPPNDARDVGAELRTLGFTVTLGIDLDQAAMEREIAGFARAAAAADVSLFYYGGHGVQIAAHNYLIPVDIQLHGEEDIYRQAMPFDKVLAALEQGGGIHLVFLDACRTNPLKDTAPSAHAEGLARVGNAAGFLIAFATQPDNVAFDGAGRNSPFAQALLGHLGTIGQRCLQHDDRGPQGRHRGDRRRRIPWENSSLTRQFAFAPGDAASGSPETLLWQLAGGQRDANLLQISLDRYPEGAHVADVKALLAEAGRPADTRADAPGASAGKENVEAVLWQLASSARERRLVELYLARYPAGAHGAEASVLLTSLQETEGADAPAGVVCERLATHPRDATANMPGVELEALARAPEPAIAACRQAVAAHPDVPHYLALLARANRGGGAARRGDRALSEGRRSRRRAGDGQPRPHSGIGRRRAQGHRRRLCAL